VKLRLGESKVTCVGWTSDTVIGMTSAMRKTENVVRSIGNRIAMCVEV
jgi:hypothetical protein